MPEEVNINQCVCDQCGDSVEEHLTTRVQGDDVCGTCFDNNYVECESCGENENHNDTYEVEGMMVCERCNDDAYYCYGCDGRYFEDSVQYDDNEGEYYCHECYDELGRRGSSYEWNVYGNEYVKTNSDFVNPKRHGYHLVNGVCVHPDSRSDERLDSFDLIPSKRPQGVEIEFNEKYDLNRSDILDNLHTSVVTGWNGAFDSFDVTRSMRIDSDGSITGEGHRYGHEVVMSPRRGDILVNDLKTVTRVIKSDYRGYISHRCGYHLHIDSRDYDWYHFMVLVAMTKLIEPHIYALLPSSRRTSQWCKPVSQSWTTFDDPRSRDEFVMWYYDNCRYSNNKYNDKRYHGLNLHSHFQANQGVELRYHSGTLNPTKMMHWSILWSQIVDKCYDIATDLKRIETEKLEDRGMLDSFGRSPLSGALKSLTDPLSAVEFDRYGFEDRSDFRQYLKRNYNYTEDEILFDRYLEDSNKLCSMLGIDVPSEGSAYSILQLASKAGIHLGTPLVCSPVLTKQAMWKLFDIPSETQHFYNEMLRDRLNNDETPPNHLLNCFRQVDRFVDYDDELHKFINVSHVVSKMTILSQDQMGILDIGDYDDRHRMQVRQNELETNEFDIDYVLG